MLVRLRLAVIAAFFFSSFAFARADTEVDQQSSDVVPYATFVEGAQAQRGLFTVWHKNGKIYLEAYDASSLGTPLYSTQAGTWPQSNGFVTPLVAGGKVYVPAQGTVNIYGLSGS